MTMTDKARLGKLLDAGARVEATIHKINGHWWNRRARPAATDLRVLLEAVPNALAASTGREEALRGIVAGLERRVATCAALVAKLDEVHAHPAYKGVWEVNQAHCGPYAGPTYTAELDAARLAMKEPAHADG